MATPIAACFSRGRESSAATHSVNCEANGWTLGWEAFKFDTPKPSQCYVRPILCSSGSLAAIDRQPAGEGDPSRW